MKLEAQVQHSADDLRDALSEFGLQLANSNITSPKHGRIATNLMVVTDNGDVFVRSYPASYAYEKVLTEVTALDYLSQKGVPVPAPIRNRQGDLVLRQEDGTALFLYKPLDGTTLSQDELSVSWAAQAGSMLNAFVCAAEYFEARPGMVDGDLDFIRGILQQLIAKTPAYGNLPVCQEMRALLDNPVLIEALAATPSGLVHADFFFENVVHQDGQLTGILDLGDAYFGKVLNDIVIGAMEFSVQSDGGWDAECLRAFVAPLKPWLSGHGIAADLCLNLMRANCIRFAVYTMPYTEQDGLAFDQNPYVQRFVALGQAPLMDVVRSSFT